MVLSDESFGDKPAVIKKSDLEKSDFGALLWRLRHAAGLTQVELAELAGLGEETIAAWERAKRHSPRADSLRKLMDALNLSPQERVLLTGAASRGRARSPAPDTPTPRGPRVDRVFPVGRSSLPPLVGREGEQAWLQGELDGGSPLILLSGEPGIGKTRVMREAMRWAHKHGWQALWGGCHRGSGQEPYAPIVEMIELSVGALSRSQSKERLRASLRGCVWLAHLLPELEDAFPTPARGSSPEQEQRRMFDAVGRYLSNTAGRAGTLLILDDLQWAGADALQLIAHLIRSKSARRIRVLGAYRSTDVPAGHPLATLTADLVRDELVSHLPLAPLDRSAAATLVSRLLEGILHDTDSDGRQRVVRRVVERTGGVPFFLLSCARWLEMLAEQGALEQHDEAGGETGPRMPGIKRREAAPWDAVPWDVAKTIEERVAALPSAARQILDVAAVVGEQASGALLARGVELSEEEALAGLKAACQAGLLVEERDKDKRERYGFTHDLIREAVETSLNALWQAVLHRRVAEALEQGFGRSGRPGELPVTRLAYHYTCADVAEKAAIYLRQAGDQARAKYAHREAAEYYQELATYLDRLGQSREAAQARRDFAVEVGRVGRFSEAIIALEEAEQICRAEGDIEALALVTIAIGHAHSARGAADEGLARLRRLVEALTREAEGSGEAATAISAGVRAQLHGALADLSFMVGRYDDAVSTAQQAVEVAQETEDDGLLARERLALGVALLTVGQIAEAVTNLKRAIDGARAAGDRETQAQALRMASWVYQTQGAFKQSRVAQEEVVALSRQLNDEVGLGQSLFLDGALAYYLGDWKRARAIGEETIATFQALDTVQLTSYAPFGLGLLGVVEGRREAAARYLDQATTIAKQSGGDTVLRLIEALWAECELLEGNAAMAYARLVPLFEECVLQERTRVELGILRAWAAMELGADAEAATYVADSVESAREHDMRLVLPDALRVQAQWELRRGNWEKAEAALEQALSLCRAMPYPYAEAKALYVYGQVHATKAEPQQACGRFEEALAICSRLGERLYAEHIERALDTLTGYAE